jgi:uncharacterized protein YndB with AHSA1/START domain
MSDPRPIEAAVEIDAPAELVWALVSDVRRMPEFSPELRKVWTFGRATGTGARFVGVNRRGVVAWPTVSTVVRWEPTRAVAWKTRESGATWVYELEPAGGRTRLVGRRILPRFTVGTTLLGPVIGGADGHDAELADGLRTTMERMKARLEA